MEKKTTTTWFLALFAVIAVTMDTSIGCTHSATNSMNAHFSFMALHYLQLITVR